MDKEALPAGGQLMTYKDIMEKIGSMLPEDQDKDASVLLMGTDEVIPLLDFVTTWNVSKADQIAMGIDQVDGVLDYGHPFFTIDF